jgi:peptidoglycan/xylan/chitin deacetylase (PgdA/CDA1 family)
LTSLHLPALLYHHVGPPRDDTYPSLTIAPERFELQMRWLARRGYVGIRASEFLAWRRSGKVLPKKSVLLTFDDAYADLTKYAFPTLRRYGFGGVALVVTGQMGGTNAWDTARGSGTHALMSSSQIQEWAAQGIEFGAHGRTHVDLTTLVAHSLSNEVEGSAADLSDLLGIPTAAFAYPYGAFNDAVRDCVKDYFELAFTTEEGLNDPGTDLYTLRRTMVASNDTQIDFACRLRLGWNPIQRVRSRLRLRSCAKGAMTRLRGRKV